MPKVERFRVQARRTWKPVPCAMVRVESPTSRLCTTFPPGRIECRGHGVLAWSPHSHCCWEVACPHSRPTHPRRRATRPRLQVHRLPILRTVLREQTPVLAAMAMPPSREFFGPSTPARMIPTVPSVTAGCSARPATGQEEPMSGRKVDRSLACLTSAQRRSLRHLGRMRNAWAVISQMRA